MPGGLASLLDPAIERNELLELPGGFPWALAPLNAEPKAVPTAAFPKNARRVKSFLSLLIGGHTSIEILDPRGRAQNHNTVPTAAFFAPVNALSLAVAVTRQVLPHQRPN